MSFYYGATLIGRVTGSDVMASPNGDQGANGTAYVNINATGGSAFDRVVATSGGNAFEFDDVAFSETISALAADPIDDVAFNATISALAADPVPEPTSLGLFGIGLLGLGFIRRR